MTDIAPCERCMFCASQTPGCTVQIVLCTPPWIVPFAEDARPASPLPRRYARYSGEMIFCPKCVNTKLLPQFLREDGKDPKLWFGEEFTELENERTSYGLVRLAGVQGAFAAAEWGDPRP